MEEKIWLVRILYRLGSKPTGCEDYRPATPEFGTPGKCAECDQPKDEHRKDTLAEIRWKGKANGPTQAILVAALGQCSADSMTEVQAIEADGGGWEP